MRPTILEGDRILVHNYAFGLRVPMTRKWVGKWGEIRRGDGETIPAVVWYSDLRGSTAMAETLGREGYTEVLNTYFEAMGGAISEAGGEILDFIGDAVLALFEIKDGERYEVDYWCDVCAIVMFEQGYCACCQDNNRIRRRLVTNGVTAERD